MRGHLRGLVVGVRLDPAAVRGDDDQLGLDPVIGEALDELACLLRLAVRQVGPDDHGARLRVEDLASTEPAATAETHADGARRVRVAHLRHGVDAAPDAVPGDPHLLPEIDTERRQGLRVH